jgi:uncharacterized membrane protein
MRIDMQHMRMTDTTFIGDPKPISMAKARGRAFLPALVPFPIACFAGAFVTDLMYWRTADVMWERFSIWLITIGMILGGVAVIAGLIDVALGKRFRTLGWPHAVGYVLALALSLLNAFVHSRDAYTAVVPAGVTLSGLVVIILLVTGWAGSALVHRHRKGVAL